MNAPAPTLKQLLVLKVIHTERQQRGSAPTIRELCDHFGWASTQAAACHLRALERGGLLTHEPAHARTWRLTPKGLRYLGEGGGQ